MIIAPANCPHGVMAAYPGITGGLIQADWALPWNELMGSHLGGLPHSDKLTAEDTIYWAHINGVFWAAFLVFSWTAGSMRITWPEMTPLCVSTIAGWPI